VTAETVEAKARRLLEAGNVQVLKIQARRRKVRRVCKGSGQLPRRVER
jgi:hypothetical protein